MNSIEAAKILGIKHDASEEEIKKAYRVKAVKTHPDKPGGSKEAFQKIKDAYDLMTYKPARVVKETSRGTRVHTYSTTIIANSGWSFYDTVMNCRCVSEDNTNDFMEFIQATRVANACDELYPNGYRFKITVNGERIVIEADTIKELVDRLWNRLARNDVMFFWDQKFQGKSRYQFMIYVAKRYMEIKGK